jgi:hypothetical protein
MAKLAVRLDGQNVGAQITAPDSDFAPLALDLATGQLLSFPDDAGNNYLTDVDLLNLKPAVDEIFRLVPYAARAASALPILEKLVAISLVGGAAPTISAINPPGAPPDLYALLVTVAGDSYLNIHLPFSADGNLAWVGSGAGVSLPLPVADNSVELVKTYTITPVADPAETAILPSNGSTQVVTLAANTILGSTDTVAAFSALTAANLSVTVAVKVITPGGFNLNVQCVDNWIGTNPGFPLAPLVVGSYLLVLTNFPDGTIMGSWQALA